MARGDHIKVWRGAYWHHGIDIGNNQVVHLSDGETGSRFMRFLSKKKSSKVEKTSMDDFLKDGEAVIGGLRNTAPALEKEEIAKRAESAVGNPSKYNIIFQNCEHFANFCETGVAKSHQVRSVLKKISVATGAAIVGGIVAHKLGVKMPKLKEDLKNSLMGKDITEQIDFVLKVGGCMDNDKSELPKSTLNGTTPDGDYGRL